MPKINQEEYEVLKNLDDKWKWIARNYNGALITFTSKPTKNPNLYWDSFGERMDDRLFQFIQWENQDPYSIAELIEGYESQFIETYNVQKELEELDRLEESEETEVKKDKKWLKEEVNEIKKLISDAWGAAIIAGNQHFEKKNSGEMQIVKRISDLIDQLDEPEVTLDKAFEKVAESYSMTKEEIWRHLEQLEAHGGKVTYDEREALSQEWIDYHEGGLLDEDEGVRVNAVSVDDLHSLLLPKHPTVEVQELIDKYSKDTMSTYDVKVERERFVKDLQSLYISKQEKVEVPQVVADWVEANKQTEEKWNDYSEEDALNDSIHHTIYGLFADYPDTNSNVELRRPVLKWLNDDRENYFKLVNAVKYGYEVKEERKYIVKLPSTVEHDDMWPIVALSKTLEGKLKVTKTSRQTDLALHDKYLLTEQEIKDYEPNYWPFAKPVEELEE